MRDLDDITTAVFNAVENIRWPAYEPIDNFADLEGEGLERPIEDWNLIRLALENDARRSVRGILQAERPVGQWSTARAS